MDSELLIKLREHFSNASIEDLKRDWAEIETLKLRGPNAYEYLDFLAESYYYYLDPVEKEYIEITKKKTLKYSGSFFFSKLAS